MLDCLIDGWLAGLAISLSSHIMECGRRALPQWSLTDRTFLHSVFVMVFWEIEKSIWRRLPAWSKASPTSLRQGSVE